MDRYLIRITSRAARDLDDILSFIDRSSPQNATGVALRLIGAIDSLEIFPRRYKVHRYRSDPARAVHSMPAPPFIVYYRVKVTNRVVEILTVRHGARRQPNRFE